MPLPSMTIPLSNAQKGDISRVAKEAWQRYKSLGLTDETEKEFRAREAIEHVKCRVSEAVNGQYNHLMAHFHNLAGNTQAALDHLRRAETDERRQAMHKLDSELKRSGLDRTYAEAICRDQNKCPLSKSTPEQLRHLMFTIRNRKRH